MKKTFLCLIAAIAAFTAQAAVTTTQFYEENFVEMGVKGEELSDGWLSFGAGGKPTSLAANFFGDGNGSAYMLLEYGSTCIAICNTEVERGEPVEEWLVTPEIEIPYDECVLYFEAACYAAKGAFGIGPNPFEIKLSPSGSAEKADFTEDVLSQSINGSVSNEVNFKKLVCPINGQKGKKIRLAFISTGRNVGFTGFTNIRLGQYYMSFESYTPEVVDMDALVDLSLNIGAKAPVTCPGLNVDVKINGEQKYSEYYRKAFGTSTNTLMFQKVEIPGVTKITSYDPLNYEIIVTPDFEGAIPSTYTGTVCVPSIDYLQNVVMEEVTATGCTYCPSGIASMEYYKETYPGKEDQGKVIGIAIHGAINRADPMMEGLQTYLNSVMDLNGITAYPQALFNRTSRGLMPERKSEVEKQIAQRSYNTASISAVEFPVGVAPEDMTGKDITVKYSVKNAYDTYSRNIHAAFVIIENDVKGFNSEYDQENAYANENEAFVKSQYGDFLVPYMKPFLQGGEYGRNPIPFNIMTYQHVARGIWPNFGGEPLSMEWTSDVAQDYEYTITIPERVMKFENTELILLVIDGNTQAIVASDVMPFKDFSVSGVKNTVAENASIVRCGNQINISAPANTAVELYSADGLLLYNATVPANGILSVDASEINGLVIVKAAGSTSKLIF